MTLTRGDFRTTAGIDNLKDSRSSQFVRSHAALLNHPPMTTFPLHLTAQVLLKDTSIRLLICVTEAAMPPSRKMHDTQAVRALASAAARTVVRRCYPHHAPAIVVPLPAIVNDSLPEVSEDRTLWQDAGVTVWLLESTLSETTA